MCEHATTERTENRPFYIHLHSFDFYLCKHEPRIKPAILSVSLSFSTIGFALGPYISPYFVEPIFSLVSPEKMQRKNYYYCAFEWFFLGLFEHRIAIYIQFSADLTCCQANLLYFHNKIKLWEEEEKNAWPSENSKMELFCIYGTRYVCRACFCDGDCVRYSAATVPHRRPSTPWRKAKQSPATK